MKTEALYKDKSPESKSEGKDLKDDFKRENETVSIRKISNGWLANKSWCEGTGAKKEYKSEEIYYAENPLDK